MFRVFLASLLGGLLPQSAAMAGAHEGTWLSQPRSALTIVIGKEGGVITGPGWEHRFGAATRNLDFEIGPGRRFMLRRSGGSWAGEYFHPPVLPENHKSETHKMAFICRAGKCS
jgi:hypothetical protein